MDLVEVLQLECQDFSGERLSEGSSKVGVCYTFSHLYIFTSTHIIFTSTHHLHICTSSHLHVYTYHLHIFTSTHIILTSSHLLSLPPSLPPSLSLSSLTLALCHGLSPLLFLFSLKSAGSADEAPRNGHPFARNEVRSSKT